MSSSESNVGRLKQATANQRVASKIERFFGLSTSFHLHAHRPGGVDQPRAQGIDDERAEVTMRWHGEATERCMNASPFFFGCDSVESTPCHQGTNVLKPPNRRKHHQRKEFTTKH
jgi:hypothetical protein